MTIFVSLQKKRHLDISGVFPFKQKILRYDFWSILPSPLSMTVDQDYGREPFAFKLNVKKR